MAFQTYSISISNYCEIEFGEFILFATLCYNILQ